MCRSKFTGSSKVGGAGLKFKLSFEVLNQQLSLTWRHLVSMSWYCCCFKRFCKGEGHSNKLCIILNNSQYILFLKSLILWRAGTVMTLNYPDFSQVLAFPSKKCEINNVKVAEGRKFVCFTPSKRHLQRISLHEKQLINLKTLEQDIQIAPTAPEWRRNRLGNLSMTSPSISQIISGGSHSCQRMRTGWMWTCIFISK